MQMRRCNARLFSDQAILPLSGVFVEPYSTTEIERANEFAKKLDLPMSTSHEILGRWALIVRSDRLELKDIGKITSKVF